jgi:hypothetical protein
VALRCVATDGSKPMYPKQRCCFGFALNSIFLMFLNIFSHQAVGIALRGRCEIQSVQDFFSACSSKTVHNINEELFHFLNISHFVSKNETQIHSLWSGFLRNPWGKSALEMNKNCNFNVLKIFIYNVRLMAWELPFSDIRTVKARKVHKSIHLRSDRRTVTECDSRKPTLRQFEDDHHPRTSRRSHETVGD